LSKWAACVALGRAEQERHLLDAAVCLLHASDVGETRALIYRTTGFLDRPALHFALAEQRLGNAVLLARTATAIQPSMTPASASTRRECASFVDLVTHRAAPSGR
jgi:hypothetical protein